MSDTKTPKIRVLIRKRPMNKKEQSRNETDIITIEKNQTIIVQEQKLKVDLTPYIDEYRFNFDGAYDEFATNEQIYATAISPLVDNAFDGAKVTCFAYGQTGSGKTHTMLGNGADVKGLYLLAAIDIFSEIKLHQELEAWISFYEIYCGKLYDLLNEKNLLFAREDAKNNVNIVGLSETKIQSAQNLMELIEYGTSIRVTSQNGTNNDSSRSHAILQITLKKKNKPHGKISFIDLAGSERAADHADQLEKQTRIDGAEINKSLLALKECIRALDQNKHHTPFRGSKLTMVLKDSFTGYCRTVMIGNVSPNSASSENTLNTLKYADRVKELKKPNKESYLQMEKIDQLEKEMMLPRNGLIKKSSKSFSGNVNDNNNNNFNINDSNIEGNSYRENFNSNNIDMMAKNKKEQHHGGYEHNKLPMNKKLVNGNLVEEGQYANNSNFIINNGHQSQQQHQRPASYENNMRKRSPTTQEVGNGGQQHFYREGNFMSNNVNSNNSHLQQQNPSQKQQQRRKSSNNVLENNYNNNHPIIPSQFNKQQSPVMNMHNHSTPPIQKHPLIQQSEPSHIQPQLTEKDLHLLSEKHDEYVQLILEEEESLLKHHEHHINSIIELTKKEMTIKAEADKIGSRIEDYLENLTEVLDNKLESIFELKERIERIREHIAESKELEEKYLVGARYMGLERQDEGEDNIMLLDDDDDIIMAGGNEKLFIN